MPRKINVVTTCMNDNLGPTVRDNTDRVMELLDLACARKPDIVNGEGDGTVKDAWRSVRQQGLGACGDHA